MDEASKKNFQALAEAHKRLQVKINELETTVKNFQKSNATLQGELKNLRQQMVFLTASRGGGPTSVN